MEDISLILASFDIKNVTDKYCNELRKQRGGKLTKKRVREAGARD